VNDAGNSNQSELGDVNRPASMVADLDFLAVIESLPNLVFVTDADGFNIYTNSEFQKFAGLKSAQLLGDGWLSVLHPDDRERAATIWATARKVQEAYEAEYRFCGEGGDYRSFLCRASPMRESGKIVYWVGSCTDIQSNVVAKMRELQRTNRALQSEIKRRESAQAALGQAHKLEALGQLTSGIAHDFKNILAAITSGMSLIEKRVEGADAVSIINHCKAAAFRGAKLVKQLLGFARQEVLKPTSVNLSELVAEIAALIRQAIPGNIVVFDIPSDLPTVMIDPVTLESVLLNLAVNADHAMPDGGTLTITARQCLVTEAKRPIELGGRDAVVVTVQDTGTGMSSEVLQRVTEPFFTTKAIGRGTGLGLAMVQGFIAQSGGALRIQSRPNKGTTIALYLPRSAEKIDAIEEIASKPAVHGHEAVLLIDDDPDLRPIISAQLRDMGYSVTEASDYTTGLRLIRGSAHFDIVISDVVMAGGDGLAVAQAVRELRPDLPILLMTGRSPIERLQTETVLHKPFTVDELSTAITEIFDLAARERAMVMRIATRARSPGVAAMLDQWTGSKTIGKMALLSQFDVTRCPEPHQLAIVQVNHSQMPMTFGFLSVGEELEASLGAPLASTDIDVRGSDDLGTIEESYRRCVKTQLPVYNYSRMNFGEGQVEHFERLILPYSIDGQLADRLVVLVAIDRTVN
jgi:PAS domain S-box-containing protein